MLPLAIDLFCGLGGWAGGLLAEGWDVVGIAKIPLPLARLAQAARLGTNDPLFWHLGGAL